ncbi:protein-disulfide reductase DsbD family protein [Lacinutrix jangbogonensis]|uniref:protein-disulfide reductase DsbD family protein n=1 Tax=Lacinutrix jangbogonensis TaxID=1469557 RepID=UPI00053E14F6|nr:thioredoxin family protein [Lacinutrix jangbogonensis]
MKKVLALLLVLFSMQTLFAQVLEPVKWTNEIQKISDKEYVLVYTASIEDHWHLYSQNLPEDGALPTEFLYDSINKTNNYNLVGKAFESESITKFDKVFEMDLTFFDIEATFAQKIEILNSDFKEIKSEISFQACDDARCIYEFEPVSFNISNAKALSKDVAKLIGSKVEIKNRKLESSDKAVYVKEEKIESKGLWATFFTSFFLGFLVLLTPCVFPMIPMTVSFFTKQSKTKAAGRKNAILYGIFIIVIYTLLGTAISAMFGSNAMYAFSTGVTFNAIMFVALLLFAFSFMGAFEIMLPNSWANKVDSQANRGGIVGIFFMALALAVVSFSCTFPIAGTALLDAATKGGIAPIISMLGFSTAIALPFALFAFFPSWLNSLPKSGGWLNTVKVVLGFLELAFAFKFLSMVDLVLDWHFLTRELFLAIWIAIFGTLGLYLLGKIKLPHDSDLKHISVGRLCMAIITLSFTFYLIPGLWGAPLKLISGFPPPMSTNSESPYGVGFMKKQRSVSGSSSFQELPEHAHLGPNDIVAFHNLDEGLTYAKKVNKPVMIDFTGKTCANCRKMEEKVWIEDKISKVLNEDIVLISLYVDDSKKLPKEERYESKLTGNTVRTYGQKWLEYQQVNYNTNAQPLYVIKDVEGNDLNEAVGYTPDEKEYLNWLKAGIGNFKK